MDATGRRSTQSRRFASLSSCTEGVALIYMYGIAEEFLHLVRSTAPEASTSEGGVPGRSPIPRPRAPSRCTASSAGWSARAAATARRAGAEAVRRRRDLGDVAGGINGVCLAKALVTGRPSPG